jgi:hypothetical protein
MQNSRTHASVNQHAANPNGYEETMENAQKYSASLRGLSFSIADLVLIRSWSEARGLTLNVRLDHGAETEEYEEVLTLYATPGRACRFLMWRDAVEVFVQPLIGRIKRYSSVPAAIAAMTPKRDVEVTDLLAPFWPDPTSPAG